MIKQVIVVRNDLNMRKGKMIAQSCHASLAAYEIAFDRDVEEFRHRTGIFAKCITWSNSGSTKICLKATSEDQLIGIYEKAVEAGIPCYLVRDEGRTEFHGVPTYTALALGPDESEKIDKITGDLELL